MRHLWMCIGVGLALAVLVLSGCRDDPANPANTPPVACFSVNPQSGPPDTLFQVDASCSTDPQDAPSALQARWDWESDGAWDTSFSTARSASHQYATTGQKTIRAEVRDTGGLTASASRTVTVTAAITPTLENIWPNTDGLSWSFAVTQRSVIDPFMPARVYSTADSCPPAPTWAELEARMGTHAFADTSETASGSYQLRFSGQGATESGMVGQNLLAEIIVPGPATTRLGTSFWSQLWAARPDLRSVLKTRGLANGDPEAPLFLHGGIWEKNQEAIITFSDLDTLPGWTYLKRDFAPGAQFTQRLVPELADNVYLHARMLPAREVELSGGGVVTAIGCLYLLDWGASHATDENGTELGFFHTFSYGTIDYAPEIGPVASDERGLVETGDVWTSGLVDTQLRLVDP